jgi:hypothetical protein
MGGLLIAVAGGLILLPSDEAAPPEFRLETVKKLKQGSTNVVVFRITALDGKETLLATPGYINVPTALGYPIFGHWTFRSLPAARCITNFSPIRFRTQMEFGVVTPTNEIWRLQVQPLRVLSRTEAWWWKIQTAWGDIRSGKPSAIRRAWSLQWGVTINHFAWSNSFTNQVSTD